MKQNLVTAIFLFFLAALVVIVINFLGLTPPLYDQFAFGSDPCSSQYPPSWC